MSLKHHLSMLLIVVLAAGALLSACAPKDDQAADGELNGTITISGAFALYPLMTRWAEDFSQLHPGVQFDISAGGAGKGMADALADAVDIGMVSRGIAPEEEAKGAAWVGVAKDAVFPMVNVANPVLVDLLKQGMTLEMFAKIYITGEITDWGQVVGKPDANLPINVYTRSDAAGAPETWAKYLGGKQEDLLGLGVFGDPGLLDAVIKDPSGIGFNNLGYAFDLSTGKPVAGSVPIPVDANENGIADPQEILESMTEATQAIASGDYPSPPARPLFLVTHGKPEGVVREFIRWILTDGQKLVGEAGYVQLTAAQLQEALTKLQ
jgi:phosphate transport system substrate-binding protein